jgi:flagellar biosynthesis protein
MGKNALAIKYDPGDKAPKIIAKGRNRLADLIIKIARENGIAIEENKLLSEALMQFDPGEYVPEETYEIIAQILAFVSKLKLD